MRVRVSSHPASQWLCRRRSVEFPRHSHPSAVPDAKLRVAPVPRLPASPPMHLRVAPNSASSGNSDWRISEFPRISCPSAVSKGEAPGCPDSSCPSAPPARGSPGCPEFRTLQRCQQCVSGLPRTSHPLAVPVIEPPGCPGLSIFQPRFRLRSGLPRNSASSGSGDRSSGCPDSPSFRLYRKCVLGLPLVLHLRLGR